MTEASQLLQRYAQTQDEEVFAELVKLHLAKRGFASTSAAITAALASMTTPAPTGLAALVSSSALAQAAALSGPGIICLQVMSTLKIKTMAITLALAAGVSVPVLMHQKIERLEHENAAFRQQMDQLAALSQENERLSRVKVNADELERLRQERGELVRLRGETGLLRRRLEQLLKPDSEKRHSPRPPDPNPETIPPGFYPADSWANHGFSSPQNSTLTFLWALRNGHAQEYSESLGKTNIMSLPMAWASALARIKGSQISETMVSEDGMPTVGILHELDDGATENSWITYKQVGDRWQIHSLIGFPIKVFQAGSSTKK